MNIIFLETILTLIPLPNININCIATFKFSTYWASVEGKDIPVVDIHLLIPAGELNGETEGGAERWQPLEPVEFEGDLAMAIWNYLTKSSDVSVLRLKPECVCAIRW